MVLGHKDFNLVNLKNQRKLDGITIKTSHVNQALYSREGTISQEGNIYLIYIDDVNTIQEKAKGEVNRVLHLNVVQGQGQTLNLKSLTLIQINVN